MDFLDTCIQLRWREFVRKFSILSQYVHEALRDRFPALTKIDLMQPKNTPDQVYQLMNNFKSIKYMKTTKL